MQGSRNAAEMEVVRSGDGSIMTRRRLLQAASAGAAVFAFGRAAESGQLVAERSLDPLSVGYLDRSEGLRDLRPQVWRRPEARELHRVVPAAAMPLGDQGLARSSVAMRVHGLYPALPPVGLASFTAVVLTVLYPSFDPLRIAPFVFYAWHARIWPGPTSGAPLSFRVPLRDDGGLDLALEVFRPPGLLADVAGRVLRGGRQGAAASAAPLRQQTLYADFTVDWYEDRPKLRRGHYFLGLAPGTWRRSWDLPASRDLGTRPPDDRTSLVVSFDAVDAGD